MLGNQAHDYKKKMMTSGLFREKVDAYRLQGGPMSEKCCDRWSRIAASGMARTGCRVETVTTTTNRGKKSKASEPAREMEFEGIVPLSQRHFVNLEQNVL